MLLFNRKAYTLSQFILLWILGILFVILVCLNIIRYRATAQARNAEAFMQEVRAEQEDRCTVGRKYAVYANHLKTFYNHEHAVKSMHFDLSSGNGIVARHKLLDFRLQMPSYADGRICCDNCQKLNRYYMHCDTLQKSKDFIPVEKECAFYPTPKTGKKAKTGKTEASKEEETAVPSTQQTREPVEKRMDPNSDSVAVSEGESVQEPAQESSSASASETESENSSSSIPEGSLPSVTDGEPSPSAQETEAQTPAPAEVSVPKCKGPSQGEFFIDECAVYQAGTRGSIVHTWNEERCAYDITQNCVLVPQWKDLSSTKEEKGLYPTDVEDYCLQLIKSAPCTRSAAAGQECAAANTVCYKDCQIINQTEVRESALVVFYDVQVKIKQLRCMPSKEVTVKVP